jgi:hypothetical protein
MCSLSRSAFLYILIGTSWVALVENDLFPNFIRLLLIEELGLIVITMLPTIAKRRIKTA